MPVFAAIALLFALAPLAAQDAVAPAPRPAASELVVLVHGMGRTSWSMRPLAEALEDAGFDVVNIGYSSLCCSIAELGAAVQQELAEHRAPQHRVVHFVGHSLGSIIVRWILTHAPPPGVGRVVMLAPPNQGSHSADRYTPVLGWLLEPMAELRTDSSATVRTLGRVTGVEIGVIAARQDGKLSLEETHLPEETAHTVVDGTHAFLMRRAEVHHLTVGFLRTGRFDVPATAAR
ncbi:MAG: alpha/beta fold hydrolase [Gemmatimonadaceae bacterium]